MGNRFTGVNCALKTGASKVGTLAACLAVTVALGLVPSAALGQDYRAPRTADGKPDLNGIWQAIGASHFDIEGHAARRGPLPKMGALGAVPGGLGIVVGGEIPYQDSAAEKKQENLENWLELDPVVKCYMPGIPRATYMPFPFQIVQTPEYILIAYEFASASRVIYMSKPDFESPFDTWMGHSRGHWEGETLVVDVTSQVPDTWFDSSGNFHTDAVHVVERYTAIGPNHLRYEATIEDPSVFTRPWQVSLPLYRRIDENMQLLEFKCVEFAEELMYGHLRKGYGETKSDE